MRKRDIPDPIQYMPQRTRHPWPIREIAVWTATVTLWGAAFFLAGVLMGLCMGG